MTHTFKKAVLFALVSMVAGVQAGFTEVEQAVSEFCRFNTPKGYALPVAALVANAVLQHGVLSKEGPAAAKKAGFMTGLSNQFNPWQVVFAQKAVLEQDELTIAVDTEVKDDADVKGLRINGVETLEAFKKLAGVEFKTGDADKAKLAKELKIAKVAAKDAKSEVVGDGKIKSFAALAQDLVLLYAIFNTFARDAAAEDASKEETIS